MTPEFEDDFEIDPESLRSTHVYYEYVIDHGHREKCILFARRVPLPDNDGKSVSYWFRRPGHKMFTRLLIEGENLTASQLQFALRSRSN